MATKKNAFAKKTVYGTGTVSPKKTAYGSQTADPKKQ
jgi:hypothetical protein